MDPKSVLFKGSLVALVTPMKANGAIDRQALRSLVDWHIAAGSHGLVIMGTTGESSLVSVDEHVDAVEIAVEQAQGKLQIIAGCGSASTAKGINLVGRLNSLAIDGFLCVTPYYVKPTQRGMVKHFEAVANACEAPLILYNVPSRTSVDLSNDMVIELARHPNIVGIKDATGDIDRAKDLVARLDPEFSLLSGDDATALDFIKVGGHGVITVTGNIAPAEVSHWCELALAGEYEKAQSVFVRLSPLNEVLFIEANPIPVKWALAQMKKISDCIRLPLTSPESQSKEQIKLALEKSAIRW